LSTKSGTSLKAVIDIAIKAIKLIGLAESAEAELEYITARDKAYCRTELVCRLIYEEKRLYIHEID